MDPVKIGQIAMASGVVGFFVGLACHFYMARRLGSDNSAPTSPAVIKWLLLELAIALASAFVTYAVPVFLVQFAGMYAVFAFAMGASSLMLRLAVLPLVLRLVAALHSGDRHRTGAVWQFLMADAFAWFGGSLLLGLGFWVLGYAVQIVAAVGRGGDMAVYMTASGAIFGFFQALSFAFVIAAYRAMDSSRHGEADVFA
jgi:hypothetical protein